MACSGLRYLIPVICLLSSPHEWHLPAERLHHFWWPSSSLSAAPLSIEMHASQSQLADAVSSTPDLTSATDELDRVDTHLVPC